MTDQPLKAPFPYFGGKSRVARLIWERFGDVNIAFMDRCAVEAFTDKLVDAVEKIQAAEKDRSDDGETKPRPTA